MARDGKYQIFLSSTSVDLQEYRKVLTTALKEMVEADVINMDDFGAIPKDAVTASEYKVAQCDIFVGIYAFRYGHVPDDRTASVTELEYDQARSLGKRCLCFFASESLRPELSREVESPMIQERLRLFKERIEKEFVRKEISSLEDLKNQVIRSFLQFLKGEPIGFYAKDVVARWRQWQRDKYSLFLESRLLSRRGRIPSPLISYWEEFRKADPWHLTLMKRLNSVQELASLLGLHELAEKAKALKELCGKDNYHKIAGQAVVFAEEALNLLGRNVAAMSRATESQSAKNREGFFHFLDLDVRRFRSEAELRRYNKAFLIMGSIGSGRTHFIAELLYATQWNNLVLPIEYEELSPEALILKGIIDATGNMQWRSVDEFHAMLEEAGVGLVIAFDELQEWQRRTFSGFEVALIDFVADHTRLHKISWLVTVKDTSFDTAILKKTVWEKYGFQPFRNPDDELRAILDRRRVDVEGWLMLDELNQSEKVGLRIIKEALDRDDYGFLRAHFDNVPKSRPMELQLCAPFFATMFIDLHKEMTDAGTLATLHHIDLVDHFWEKIGKSLVPVLHERELDKLYSREDLGRLASLVATVMAKKETVSPLKDTVVAEVVLEAPGRFSDAGRTRSLLEVLVDGRLLEVEKKKVSAFGEEEEYVKLRFEIFWKNKLAMRLLEMNEVDGKLRDDTEKQIENWFEKTKAEDLKEGVVEFILLRLDMVATKEGHATEVQAFWKGVLDSAALPASAVWFAAPKSRVISEATFLDWAWTRPVYPDRHLLFSYMYYLGAAAVDEKALPRRFASIRRHYRDIAGEGLSNYFVFIFIRLFDQCTTTGAALRCMSHLSGCEVMDAAGVLAEVCLSKIVVLHAEDERAVIGTMYRFLKDQGCRATEDYGLLFTEDDFYIGKKDLRQLCTAVNKKIGGQVSEVDDLASLNALVARSDLADSLMASGAQVPWSVEVRKLVEKTKRLRTMGFKDLDPAGQAKVKKLNRMIIQELCPEECPSLPGQWQRKYLREWMICHFCRWLTRKKRMNAYHFLVGRNWYAAGKEIAINHSISVEMQREANIAMGAAYRNIFTEKEKKEYEYEVEQLLDKEPVKVERAFHLIRHTTETSGRDLKRTEIAPVFHDMLRTIYRSDKINHTIETYIDLFRYNLDDFPALEKARQKRLAKKAVFEGGAPKDTPTRRGTRRR